MNHLQNTKWASIIVAAGTGSRFGNATPKQFLPLLGKPVLAYSLERLMPHGTLILVVDDPENSPANEILSHYPQAKDSVKLVKGGSTRQESVKNGLQALSQNAPDFVMIHDAARPLLDSQSLSRLMQEIEKGTQAATLSMQLHDTIMRQNDPIDRTGVYTIQTPQAFNYKGILSAHEQAQNSFTDDASLIHAINKTPIVFVEGSHDNFKITTQTDFIRAEKMLLSSFPEIRTGMAFDVHRFGNEAPDQHITLCGVNIKSPRPLLGHSDADAPLHALADAILGTIGAGDIGTHFPPTDPQWKGMASSIIVKRALELLHERGGIIRHADIMIMAELPKIGPHREAMQNRLSEILGLPTDAIGLKATTMEQMGFVGRGEGIAAQAVVTVRLP